MHDVPSSQHFIHSEQNEKGMIFLDILIVTIIMKVAITMKPACFLGMFSETLERALPETQRGGDGIARAVPNQIECPAVSVLTREATIGAVNSRASSWILNTARPAREASARANPTSWFPARTRCEGASSVPAGCGRVAGAKGRGAKSSRFSPRNLHHFSKKPIFAMGGAAFQGSFAVQVIE